jgi:hypothetical protein
MMSGILVALALVVALGPQAPLPGFKMTVKLVVNGPGLRNDVEITDPPAIAANVYGGNFMTTTATEPDKTWPRYRVAFYINTRERGVVLAYAVSYVRSPKTGEGFVYLPGRGEADYGLNISTVIRDGGSSPGLQLARDGAWQHVDAAWGAAINAYLPRAI